MRLTPCIFTIITTISLLTIPFHEASAARPAPLVVVAEVLEKPARPNRAIPGSVIPLLEATIASQINGLVLNTPFQTGDKVKKGATLVVVDKLDILRQKQIQQTIIAEAKANLTHARNNLARDKKLKNTPAISRQRLDDRITEEEVRSAILEQAKTKLMQINDMLNRHTITAPFSGVITKKLIQQGEWLKEGQGVVTLLDPNQLEVQALIPTNMASTLKEGATANVYFTKQGVEDTITLRTILPRQNSVSRNQPSYWKINKTSKTIAGEEVALTIPLGANATMLLVLKDAVIRKGNKNLVFIVDDDTIKMADVQLGPSINTYFQVIKGLKAGQKVVVRGNERLRPGQKVRTTQLTGSSPSTKIDGVK
ncbi:MAG: efflux RND transporter periplasmic adaptor subunit [Magnetococcales bacterium]|nr:efflux RND transporter periplasmic adaptor subunit [Magnetococcales bacterium]